MTLITYPWKLRYRSHNDDLVQFSDSAVTYTLNDVEPAIQEKEIEAAFTHSHILQRQGYQFLSDHLDIPETYRLILPDQTQRMITFKSEIFDANPTQVEYLGYMHPLFHKLLDHLWQI